VPTQRPAVNIVTVKKADDMLFISTFYHGPMMVKVDAEEGANQERENRPADPARLRALSSERISPQRHGDTEKFKMESIKRKSSRLLSFHFPLSIFICLALCLCASAVSSYECS